MSFSCFYHIFKREKEREKEKERERERERELVEGHRKYLSAKNSDNNAQLTVKRICEESKSAKS